MKSIKTRLFCGIFIIIVGAQFSCDKPTDSQSTQLQGSNAPDKGSEASGTGNSKDTIIKKEELINEDPNEKKTEMPEPIPQEPKVQTGTSKNPLNDGPEIQEPVIIKDQTEESQVEGPINQQEKERALKLEEDRKSQEAEEKKK